MTISTGHLCSGYDGFGRALTLALGEHETLWHAEVDEDASATLAKHDPGVLNVGDLVQLVLDDLWRLAPVPDILTAGFPCQPISAAGRGLAELDHRWLWPFVAEIVRTVRPSALFLENVQRIVSIQGGAILRGILTDLRAARYAVRWGVVGACAVGAPHHRHRWFLVAAYVPTGPVPEAIAVAPKAICGAPRMGGRILLPSPMARDGDGRGEGDEAYWARRAVMRDNGLPLGAVVGMLPSPRATDGDRGGESDRAARTGTGGTLTDAVCALLPTPTTSNGHGNHVNGRGESLLPGAVCALLPTPTAHDSRGRIRSASVSQARLDSGRRNIEDAVAPLADPVRWGKYAEAVALWEHVLGRAAPEPTVPGPKGGRRLNPELPEWMMGLPSGYLTGHLPRAAALKQAGNGVVPQQAAAAWRLLTAKLPS